jgi:hypothetical protein
VFNLSSSILSPLDTLALGLGLKFIPRMPMSPKARLTSLLHSISQLKRRLSIALYFGHTPQSTPPDGIPYVTNSTWHPPDQLWTPTLNHYIRHVTELSTQCLQTTHAPYSPSDRLLYNTLLTLRRNTSIVIKPADKNLGLVVMDTSQYEQICLAHLNDSSTYIPVVDYDPKVLYGRLRFVLSQHNILYKKEVNPSRPRFVHTKLATSLLQLEKEKSLRVGPFYCLPKMHKGTSPLTGRPLVSSISTATYHTSVYLDNILKRILPKLSTICTSSQHVLRDVHKFCVPHDSVILCADVRSLYPSIPIDFGLAAVRNTLTRLNCFTPNDLELYLDLLEWVLRYNYCTFKGVIYHQIKGTAMGTPVAPTYANIVLFDMEHPVLERYPPLFYRRYIDDLFVILSRIIANSFVTDFNSIHPSIQLEAITIDSHGVFLDILFKLIEYDATNLIVSHSLYQKPINKYQYIPPHSQHKPSVFYNLILQELKRYHLLCESTDDFFTIVTAFRKRLTTRGYSPHLLTRALTALPLREQLLTKLLNPVQRPVSNVPPVVTLQLPRLFPKPLWRTIFTIPPVLTGFSDYRAVYGNKNIVIGEKLLPNIARLITRSLYNPATNTQ